MITPPGPPRQRRTSPFARHDRPDRDGTSAMPAPLVGNGRVARSVRDGWPVEVGRRRGRIAIAVEEGRDGSSRRSAPECAQPVEPAPAATIAERADELTDHEVVGLIKTGIAVGTPVVLAVLMVVGWLAVPGQPVVLVAVAWPALFAGWYFGTITALAIHERRHQQLRPASRPAATPSPAPADPARQPAARAGHHTHRDPPVGLRQGGVP